LAPPGPPPKRRPGRRSKRPDKTWRLWRSVAKGVAKGPVIFDQKSINKTIFSGLSINCFILNGLKSS
jgi:hypothetical protein